MPRRLTVQYLFDDRCECELEVNQFYFQVKWSHSANC